MRLSPDELLVFSVGEVGITATVVYTWAAMLIALPLLIFYRRSMLVEVVVEFIRGQVAAVSGREDMQVMTFVGALFIFIFANNWLVLIPFVDPATASISTCAALAILTFIYGIYIAVREVGVRGYFRRFIEPSAILVPFNVLSEILKFFSLAMRLYGNIMSGAFMVGLMIVLAPFFFPALMNLFGLIAGTIQPFIFMVLATVYITTGVEAKKSRVSHSHNNSQKQGGKNARP
ncbi:MAG: F0F1 ATP synthase subunit A [Alphaproteobacteria bacterium]|nr:F0F1 ATP synthase subunit A [Alphaproteobacteria bacterium]